MGCIALKGKRVLLSLLAILKDVIKCYEKQNRWLNDKAIIELGFRKNRDLSVDLLASDKSRYYVQPLPTMA